MMVRWRRDGNDDLVEESDGTDARESTRAEEKRRGVRYELGVEVPFYMGSGKCRGGVAGATAGHQWPLYLAGLRGWLSRGLMGP
jgi:hypothetical protein